MTCIPPLLSTNLSPPEPDTSSKTEDGIEYNLLSGLFGQIFSATDIFYMIIFNPVYRIGNPLWLRGRRWISNRFFDTSRSSCARTLRGVDLHLYFKPIYRFSKSLYLSHINIGRGF